MEVELALGDVARVVRDRVGDVVARHGGDAQDRDRSLARVRLLAAVFGRLYLLPVRRHQEPAQVRLAPSW